MYLLIHAVWRTVKIRNTPSYNFLDGSTKVFNIPTVRSEESIEEDGVRIIDEEDENNRLVLQKVTSQAHPSVVDINHPGGELLAPLLEIFALLGEIGINVAALLLQERKSNESLAAFAGLITWSYILLLTLVRILPLYARFRSLLHLWNHTAVLYGLKWLCAALTFRSAIVHPPSIVARNLKIVEFVLASLLFLIALTTRNGNKAIILEYEDNLKPSREPLASLLSLATFSWVDTIVLQGYRKTLELPDVWNLAPKDKAAAILADFRQVAKTSRLAWHLLKYFKSSLIAQAGWAAIAGFFTFVPTLLLKVILEYVEDYERTPANAAWFYVILLAVTTCIEAITNGQALWLGRKICIRLRAIIIGEIYAKALRRKIGAGSDTILGDAVKKENEANEDAKQHKKLSFGRKKKDTAKAFTEDRKTTIKDTTDTQVNVGTIINLMAVDSFKVSEISAYLHFLWACTPVQLVVAITLLYRILGYSSIASIGVMVLVAPLNIFIAKQFSVTQKKVMAATDGRIHTTNEVLQNIRIIKYFAWEQRFGQAVNEKRTIELHALRNRYILWAFAATVWAAVPILVTFLSFYIYTVVEKRALIPSVAFTALSLFSILRIPLDQLADMIARVQEAKVSVDRVEEFLNEEETEKYAQLISEKKDENGEAIVGLDEATLTWGGKNVRTQEGLTAFQMIGMNVRFHVGRLNIIAGPTGSGKTSLLMALLGEMTLLEGAVYLPGGRSREELNRNPETGLTESVAYCAQQAWLVNDTIKQNILFASPLDEGRYKSVIAACALERDLEILDAGDATLVGEKGITLSGGQKQRVSLARALYCNSRHVLLDDCLSAVDSHTAKHIFEHCVMGPLMLDRTCILVTHNVALCVPSSHYVVVLANGKIATQGSPDIVMSSGALGEDLKTSRPTSKSGTTTHSRVASALRLDIALTNNAKKVNGDANRSVDEPNSKLKQQHQNENANIRTEGKAEGGVKWPVIKMYLAAMGPWYFWIAAAFAFVAQQLGSIATNVWIREWANAYQIKPTADTSIRRMVNYLRGNANLHSVSCLSGEVCAWNLRPRPSLQLNPTVTETYRTTETSEVNVTYYLGIYALIGLLYLLVSLFREAVLFWGSINASRTLHERLLESVARAKFKFFDSTPLGQLMNRFSKDIETIDQEVAAIAMGLIHCMASITTIVILISVITPGFLIAGVFITVIYFAIGKLYIRSSRDLKRLESVQRSPLYQQFGETLSGISTIRAYGDERRFIRDNQVRVNTHSRPFIYLWSANRWLALRVDFTGALVSFFAGVFVIMSVGKIDAGAAGLSLTYAVTFTENVLWLVRLYANNEQNMNSIERVKEYMDVEQEAKAIIPENRPPGNWPSHGAIDIINYTTRYRSDLDPVLRHVTFKVQPGERVGIVGRTGAGKSSLALALFRGLEAEDGKILIDDVDIGLIGLQDLRESITIVPQDPTLFSGTVRNNLDPFGLFTDEVIFAALRRVQLIDATTLKSLAKPQTSDFPSSSVPTPLTSSSSSDTVFDAEHADVTKILTNTRENTNIFKTLSSPIAESGSNLSQGQRQLLCLARALLKAPRILLMDEATASIDYATDAKIQDTLREVEDSTIITIAHRLQTIIDYDKVLVLEKGEVIEYDSPWELIEKDGGVFRSMCEMSGDMDGLVQEARKAGAKRKLVDV